MKQRKSLLVISGWIFTAFLLWTLKDLQIAASEGKFNELLHQIISHYYQGMTSLFLSPKPRTLGAFKTSCYPKQGVTTDSVVAFAPPNIFVSIKLLLCLGCKLWDYNK